ncbi:hypothetical protein CITSP_04052 [Citrobacter sp. T1.2D-1]|nr:hypothetical protein CITSP_04052 [Citrobacter sp. T1.2D-1]
MLLNKQVLRSVAWVGHSFEDCAISRQRYVKMPVTHYIVSRRD